MRHAALLPLSPDTCPQVLAHRLDAVAGPAQHRARALGKLAASSPHSTTCPPDGDGSRADRGAPVRGDRQAPATAALLEDHRRCTARRRSLRIVNGTEGSPASFDLLDRLLSHQTYRLADWRVAGDEVDYHLLDVDQFLAAVRMEVPEVFDIAHRLVLALVGEGKVTGLRIDHPDGLYAPVGFFARLQEGAVLSTTSASCRTSARATSRRSPRSTAPRSRPTRRRRRRGRSGSSPRRSSCPASPCPSGGSWRARRATTSWARSTGSSWIAAPRGA